MRYLNLLLAVALLITSGCERTTSPCSANNLQSLPMMSTTVSAQATVEVRYATHLSPAPLTPQQLNEIISEAREADAPAGRNIWFVLVHANYEHEGSSHYRATVYFTPSTRSPRIRRGQFVTIGWNFSPQTEREIREKLGTKRHVFEFVQISPAQQPFGPSLKVPNDSQLPFSPPENIKESDLIAIVDAARQVHDADSSLAPEPVYRIDTDQADHLRVWFGHQDGPLAGLGSIVTVYKRPSGYKADEHIVRWVS